MLSPNPTARLLHAAAREYKRALALDPAFADARAAPASLRAR